MTTFYASCIQTILLSFVFYILNPVTLLNIMPILPITLLLSLFCLFCVKHAYTKKYIGFVIFMLLYALIYFIIYFILGIDLYDIIKNKSYLIKELYVNILIVVTYLIVQYILLLLIAKISRIRFTSATQKLYLIDEKPSNLILSGFFVIYIYSNMFLFITLPQYTHEQDGNNIAIAINFMELFQKNILFMLSHVFAYLVLYVVCQFVIQKSNMKRYYE
jgi:hypothetical protein